MEQPIVSAIDPKKDPSQIATEQLQALSLVQEKLIELKNTYHKTLQSGLDANIQTIESYKSFFNQDVLLNQTQEHADKYKNVIFPFLYGILKTTVQDSLHKEDDYYIEIESQESFFKNTSDSLESNVLNWCQLYTGLVNRTYLHVLEEISHYEDMYTYLRELYTQNPLFVCTSEKGNNLCDKYTHLCADILTKIWTFRQFFILIIHLKGLAGLQPFDEDIEDIKTDILKHPCNTIADLEQVQAHLDKNYQKIITLAQYVFDYLKKETENFMPSANVKSFNEYKKQFFDFLLIKSNKVTLEKAVPDFFDFDLADLIIFLYGCGYLNIENHLIAFKITDPLQSSLFIGCKEIETLYQAIISAMTVDKEVQFSFKDIQNNFYRLLRLQDNKKLFEELWNKEFDNRNIFDNFHFQRSIEYTVVRRSFDNDITLKNVNVEIDGRPLSGVQCVDLMKQRAKKFNVILKWIKDHGYFTKDMQLAMQPKEPYFIIDFLNTCLLKPFLRVMENNIKRGQKNGLLVSSQEFDRIDVSEHYIKPFNRLHELFLKNTFKNILKKVKDLKLISEDEINALIMVKRNKNFFLENVLEYLKDKFINRYKLLPLNEADLAANIRRVKSIILEEPLTEDLVDAIILKWEEEYKDYKEYLNTQANIKIGIENKEIIDRTYITWAQENNLLPENFQFHSLDQLQEVVKDSLQKLLKKTDFKDLKDKLKNALSLQELTRIYNEYLIKKAAKVENAKIVVQEEVAEQQPPSAYSLSAIWNRMTSWYSKLHFKKPVK